MDVKFDAGSAAHPALGVRSPGFDAAGFDDLREELGRKVDLAIIERGGLLGGGPWLRVR